MTLSLSNEQFGNSFDQAIGLLAQNEEGLYGEQTGPQLPPKVLALRNEYLANQADADQARQDAEDFARPSSQRVSKRK